MDKVAALCTLCLALAFTSAAVPHRNRRLRHSAMKLLAWTEEKAGEIFSEILLGKHLVNGKAIYDPVVLTDFTSFLQELSSRMATLSTAVRADTSTAAGHSGHGREHGRGRRLTTTGLVLPPGSDVQNMDYNDILDIIGDYTKAFVDMLLPQLPVLFLKRELVAHQTDEFVHEVLSQIAQIQSLNRQ